MNSRRKSLASGSDLRAAWRKLADASRDGETFAAHSIRSGLIATFSGEALVATARRATAAGDQKTGTTVLVELLTQRLQQDRYREPHEVGEVARRVLGPLGVNIDARIGDYVTLYAELLPKILSTLAPDETLSRHLLPELGQLDVRVLAVEQANQVLEGLNLDDGVKSLGESVERMSAARRDAELNWLLAELRIAYTPPLGGFLASAWEEAIRISGRHIPAGLALGREATELFAVRLFFGTSGDVTTALASVLARQADVRKLDKGHCL